MDGRIDRSAAFTLSPPLPPQKIALQVDTSRQVDYRRWLLLGLLLLAAALFNGSQRSASLSRGYKLAASQSLRAEEEETGRRLRQEVASLESPALIERLACDQLRMVRPGPNDQIVLPLVVPPQPPPSSVVASR